MKVWSISSGSSGNCYLVKEGESLILLEAGISVRRIEREMAELGLLPSQLTAILASHEHVDHWQAAVALARRFRLPLVCSPGSWEGAAVRGKVGSLLPIKPGGSLRLGEFSIEAFSLPHDAREPVGFHLRSHVASLCIATDMGWATEEIVERGRAADLVIVEANHDEEMLVRGPYPAALKARILGQQGHISNADCGRAIVQMARGQPRNFWLAHLSHTNNSPHVALSTVKTLLHREGLERLAVDVALRDRRSLFWDSQAAPMVQLSLW